MRSRRSRRSTHGPGWTWATRRPSAGHHGEDRAHTVPGGSTTREAMYTAMTRAAAESHVYIPVEEHLGMELKRAPDARGAGEEVFRRIVAREGAERSATETVCAEVAAPERLDRLVPEYVHAVEVMSAEQQETKRRSWRGSSGRTVRMRGWPRTHRRRCWQSWT